VSENDEAQPTLERIVGGPKTDTRTPEDHLPDYVMLDFADVYATRQEASRPESRRSVAPAAFGT